MRVSFLFLVAVGGTLSGPVAPANCFGQASMGPRELASAALEVYNERGEEPLPFLSSAQLDALLDGDVVRVRDRAPAAEGEDRPERVVGYRLVPLAREKVWLAALDPGFQASDILTEVRLEQDDHGRSLWYQHVSLPWPVSDRHWVIQLEKGLSLCESTQGLIWEQRWDLAPDGPAIAARTVAAGRAGDLTPENVAKAIYLPVNRGAWILFSLDEELTLLAYRVSTVVGGSIPESWIATFAMAQLDNLLDGVVRHAGEAWRDYDPQRSAIYDGCGRLLPRTDGAAGRR